MMELQLQKDIDIDIDIDTDTDIDSTHVKKTKQEEDNIVLVNKNGLLLTKQSKNKFELKYTVKNPYLCMKDILQFEFIKLIYDLNPDIYEKVYLHKINETEAIIITIIKHFFKDLGIPQKYSYLHVHKYVDNDKVVFVSRPCTFPLPNNILPENAELSNLKEIITTCFFEGSCSHKINVFNTILFKERDNIPIFLEKMIGNIIYKICIRIQTFLENISTDNIIQINTTNDFILNKNDL